MNSPFPSLEPKEQAAAPIAASSGRDAPYATLFEASPDAIILVDCAGGIIEWNPAAEDIFGYTRALAMGRDAVGLVMPHAAGEPPSSELSRNLKTGKGRLIGKRTEMTAVRANGGEFPVELTLSRTLACGLPAFTLCIRDMTERKVAEAALRRSEERFRMLVESVEDYAIQLLDPAGRILTSNAGVERIDGYRARDIIGRRFNRLYTPADIALGRPEQALVTAGADGRYSHECWSVRRDGTCYWASVVFTALRFENGALFGYSRIGRDCTKDKEAETKAAALTVALEARLRERTAELQAATRLLDEAMAR